MTCNDIWAGTPLVLCVPKQAEQGCTQTVNSLECETCDDIGAAHGVSGEQIKAWCVPVPFTKRPPHPTDLHGCSQELVPRLQRYLDQHSSLRQTLNDLTASTLSIAHVFSLQPNLVSHSVPSIKTSACSSAAGVSTHPPSERKYQIPYVKFRNPLPCHSAVLPRDGASHY